MPGALVSRNPWLVLKWVALAAAMALLVWVAVRFAAAGELPAVVGAAFLAMCVLVIYASRRFVPMKYLFPGLVFLVLLQIFPIVLTVLTSFTNFGDGHTGTKEDSITFLVLQSVREVEGAPRYALSVAVPAGADVTSAPPAYLLTDPATGTSFVGSADGLTELAAGSYQKSDTGKITQATGYTILNAREINARADLAEFAVPTADGGGIKRVGLSEAFVGKPTLVYDRAADVLVDTVTNTRYVAANARWVPESGAGAPLSSGWQENVGMRNYLEALSNPTLREGFLKVLGWNLIFPLITVLATFLLGMALALLFNDDRVKFKGLWRSLLILPYALPGFVTALVWRQMFNQDENFGLINKTFGANIDWLGDATWAKVAILITNIWLGFPYMFLICTGALQAVPSDVKEAAKIDGASGFRTIRSITMPLVLVAVGPLLVASYAFNFNNFTLIYLLTEGGPFEGGQTQIGSTDLLITYAYRLAIGGTTPNYGFAAAISVFIFIIVALISAQGFSRTAKLEDVN